MLDDFIKTIWVAGILKALEKSHVYASVANRDYQGQINSLGDKVRIMAINSPTIKDYSRNADIDAPQNATDTATELEINQAHYFNIKLNDVDAVQEKPLLLQEYTRMAAYGFRDKVDAYFASLFAQAGMTSYATGTTPWTVTSANVDDILIIANEIMGNNNVPREGRFMIVPEWFHGKLVLSGLITKTQNDELFANGFVSKVLGWDIYISPNVHHASANTNAKILCGIKNQSFSFADSINNIEAYRPERRFEDAIKGLYIFGGKIMRPDMTLCVYASKGND